MFKLPILFRISLLCRSVHPCALDPGTNLSGTDLHLPEGRQAGQPDVNPCRDDDLFVVSYFVWVCDFLDQKS